MVDLWAMSVAPAIRLAEVTEAFESTGISSDRWVLVTTLPSPIDQEDFPGKVFFFFSEEINISKWWNLAEDYIQGANDIRSIGEYKWDVLLIESDARMTPEDIETVRTVMREENCIMAGADWKGLLTDGQQKVRRDNSRWRVDGRLPGTCHVFAGEAGLRHDPEFRWFLSDDDWVWNHQSNGGDSTCCKHHS